MAAGPSKSVLFEMLKSFTTLGRTLNLSRTTKRLGFTRQTVRRHIDTLEEFKGTKLFEIEDRQYYLTDAGARCIEDAEKILDKADAWINGEEDIFGGLSKVMHEEPGGYVFYSQQHPIHRIWQDSPVLLQRGLEAWCASQGHLEHPAMAAITPYLVVYRNHHDSWINVKIGEKSSIATWLGWVWAKSTIGCELVADPMHSDADKYVIDAYSNIVQTGSIRLDHMHTRIPREEGGKLEAVSHHRLLFCGLFPNGQSAAVTLVARTNQIDIDGIDPDSLPKMQAQDLMEFDIAHEVAAE